MADVLAIPHRSEVVKTRRGYALLLLGLVIPGSAQLIYGRRGLGRFAVGLWMAVVSVVVLGGLATLVFHEQVFAVLNIKIVEYVVVGLAGAVALFWVFLIVNTWWIARPRQMGAKKGIVFSVATALPLLLAVALAVSAVMAKMAADTIGNVTNKDCGLGCIIQQAGQAAGVTPTKPLKADSNGRTNVLLLGTSDDRILGDDGDDGMWLTDSIMVLSISQEKKDAYMVSIPRDLWVKYPSKCEYGSQGKVNVVYMCNGGDTTDVVTDRAALTATIPTFETVTGLDIQYAVNINYSVLRDLVTAVGGHITVTISCTDPRGIYDVNTDLTLPAGTSTIDAETALRLAKARNSDGGYGLAYSNFNREQNQQAIIKGLVQQAQQNSFFTNAAGMSAALKGLGNNLRSTFSPDDITTMMSLAQSFTADNFHSIDLINASPAIIGTPMIDGQSAVAPLAGTFDYSELRRFIANSMSENTLATEAAVVDVLNGTDQSGLAARNASALTDAGFTVGYVGDYPGTAPGATKIYQLGTGDPATAAALTAKYGVAVTPGPVPGYPDTTADFVVVLG